VTAQIDTDAHATVAGAIVTGTWSGVGTPVTCTTAANGRCSASRSGIEKKLASTTFTVTSITHATRVYQGSANHDPDGESNGTSIAVSKP
jgi:hypothetical protein